MGETDDASARVRHADDDVRASGGVRGRGYVASLDGLRAVAVLLVMAHHAELLECGWAGVQLFFVLSGFLITGILLREREATAPLGEKLRVFWLRRALRIFPVYYFALAIFAVKPWGRIDGIAPLWQALPSLATYTFNIGDEMLRWPRHPTYTHFWSLCVEEQFYLVFPLVVLTVPRRVLAWLFPAIVLVSPAVRAFALVRARQHGFTPWVAEAAASWPTVCQLDAFLIGGAIPLFRASERVKKPVALFVVGAVALMATGAWEAVCNPARSVVPMAIGHASASFRMRHIWDFTVVDGAFAALVLVLVSDAGGRLRAALTRVLTARPLVAVGRVSYGMYVFHWVILVALEVPIEHMLGLPRLVTFLVQIAGTFAVANVVYEHVELPFMRLKRRVVVRGTGPG